MFVSFLFFPDIPSESRYHDTQEHILSRVEFRTKYLHRFVFLHVLGRFQIRGYRGPAFWHHVLRAGLRYSW